MATRPVEVLAEFLGLVSDWPIDGKAVFLERMSHNSGCLALFQAHNYAYVMPVVAWGRTIQSELDQAGTVRSITPCR